MTTPQLPAALCAICARREARVGRVCWRDHDLLRDLLDPRQTGTRWDPARPDDVVTAPSIPVLLGQLDATPGTSGPPVGGGGSAFGSRPPCDLEVIAIGDSRSTMLGLVDPQRPPLVVLRALARRLGIAARQDPVALCASLYAALDRLCRADWVHEAYRELRAISGRLRAADGDRASAPVGTCRALVDDDGHEQPAGRWRCAWPLWLPDLPPRADDEPVTVPSLRCGSCGHRYSGFELVQLGRQQAGVAA